MRLTRRDFLGLACQTALYGCAVSRERYRPPLSASAIQNSAGERVAWTNSFVRARTDKQVYPCHPYGAVSIVRLDNPVKAIKMAIELIDGLSFIKTGDTVLIKPAVNSEIPFPAATDPLMLSTVINMVKERGAGAIIVAERAGVWRDTERCMKTTGIYMAAVESKAEIIFLENEEHIKVHPSLAPGWMFGYSLPKMLSKIDHIISLPTIRTHGSADFTMSLKNNMGFITQWERNFMHTSLMLQIRIAELGLVIKPSLVILDGRKAFSAGGPNKGTLKSPGVVIAGRNMVACDTLGLAVLKHNGTTKKLQNTSIWEIPQIKRAIELGLGSKGIEEIRHHGMDEIQELKALVA